MVAGGAGHLAGDALEMELRFCCHGVLGNDLPIKMYRIIDNGGELPDHQIDLLDFSVLGVLEDDIKDALGDREFVHDILLMIFVGARRVVPLLGQAQGPALTCQSDPAPFARPAAQQRQLLG